MENIKEHVEKTVEEMSDESFTWNPGATSPAGIGIERVKPLLGACGDPVSDVLCGQFTRTAEVKSISNRAENAASTSESTQIEKDQRVCRRGTAKENEEEIQETVKYTWSGWKVQLPMRFRSIDGHAVRKSMDKIMMFGC